MRLGEWIRHFKPFSIYIHVVFFIGDIKFDIPSLRNLFPKLHRIDINCLKNEPNERDILNAQNLLRAFLSNVQNVGLFRVPLRENFSLQHIAMANLKHLEVDYRSKMDFVDICSWNVESCMISTFSDQMSIRDLNRFFKLWIKGLNPMLKELSIYWPTEIIPDWNVLLKGLNSIETEADGEEEDDEDDEERGAKKYIIKNVRGSNAIIKVMHADGDCGVVKFVLKN
ncbi:unnamed protein product [Caenorhabditis nigoni]|uniref:Sdz-33 F-box domain-containing protein n=1 Tax=Caenorhabditis nigoni TaxID=1611254 RepID=A0A2G5T414_9PELO|nr:hypothetical protein B9Z55_026512 [Caenorhabditis nigoni]